MIAVIDNGIMIIIHRAGPNGIVGTFGNVLVSREVKEGNLITLVHDDSYYLYVENKLDYVYFFLTKAFTRGFSMSAVRASYIRISMERGNSGYVL